MVDCALVIRLAPVTSCALNMFDIGNPVHWLIGVTVLAAFAFLLRSYFSPESRERRRRMRNHGRVVSKAQRPMVSLAVRTEKTKDERRR